MTDYIEKTVKKDALCAARMMEFNRTSGQTNPLSRQLILGQTVAPLVERTIKNDLESRTLTRTRDLLLPKLMTGETHLSEAEKAVETVA